MIIYKDGVIGVIKIIRKHLKDSINIKTLLEIEKALDQWKNHNGIKIIVFTIESGLILDTDLGRVQDKEVQDILILYLSNICKKIKNLNKVTMAVINSDVYAEELVLAMASDIRIAVENIKLVNVTGEIITAENAKEIGIISKVVPKEQLWETVLDQVFQMLGKNPTGSTLEL